MRLWVLAMGLTSRPEGIRTSPLLSPAENLTAVAAQTNGWAKHRTEPMMQIDSMSVRLGTRDLLDPGLEQRPGVM